MGSVIQRGCQLPRLVSAIVNEYEHEALCNDTDGGKMKCSEKPAGVPPYGLAWGRPRASALKRRLLTA